MNLLAAALPGIRHLRTPLIAGYVLLLAAAVLYFGGVTAADLATLVGPRQPYDVTDVARLVSVAAVPAYVLGVVGLAVADGVRWLGRRFSTVALPMALGIRHRAGLPVSTWHRRWTRVLPALGTDLRTARVVAGLHGARWRAEKWSRPYDWRLRWEKTYYLFDLVRPRLTTWDLCRQAIETLDDEDAAEVASFFVRHWSIRGLGALAPDGLLQLSWSLQHAKLKHSVTPELVQAFWNEALDACRDNVFRGWFAIAVAVSSRAEYALNNEMRSLPVRLVHKSLPGHERWDLLSSESEFREGMAVALAALVTTCAATNSVDAWTTAAGLAGCAVLAVNGRTKDYQARMLLMHTLSSGALETPSVARLLPDLGGGPGRAASPLPATGPVTVAGPAADPVDAGTAQAPAVERRAIGSRLRSRAAGSG